MSLPSPLADFERKNPKIRRYEDKRKELVSLLTKGLKQLHHKFLQDVKQQLDQLVIKAAEIEEEQHELLVEKEKELASAVDENLRLSRDLSWCEAELGSKSKEFDDVKRLLDEKTIALQQLEARLTTAFEANLQHIETIKRSEERASIAEETEAVKKQIIEKDERLKQLEETIDIKDEQLRSLQADILITSEKLKETEVKLKECCLELQISKKLAQTTKIRQLEMLQPSSEIKSMIEQLRGETSAVNRYIDDYNSSRKLSDGRMTKQKPSLPAHLQRLQQVRQQVVDKLEAKKVAGLMFQFDSLTTGEWESVLSSKTSVEAATKLVELVLREKSEEEVYFCFLKALEASEQHHIWTLLSFADQNIGDEHINVIRTHYSYLTKNLDLRNLCLLDELYSRKVLDDIDMEDLNCEPVNTRRIWKLLLMLSKKSAEQFDDFLDVLETIQHQQHIAFELRGEGSGSLSVTHVIPANGRRAVVSVTSVNNLLKTSTLQQLEARLVTALEANSQLHQIVSRDGEGASVADITEKLKKKIIKRDDRLRQLEKDISVRDEQLTRMEADLRNASEKLNKMENEYLPLQISKRLTQTTKIRQLEKLRPSSEIRSMIEQLREDISAANRNVQVCNSAHRLSYGYRSVDDPDKVTKPKSSLPAHLQRLQQARQQVVDKLEAFKVAGLMFQKDVLTISEWESVLSNKKPAKAATRLVDLVLNESDEEMYFCFLEALKTSEQHHIWTLLSFAVTHVIPADGDREVVGVTSVNNQLFVLRDPSRQEIEVYDTKNFTFQRKLRVHGLSDSDGNSLTSCIRNNCLYVGDCGSKTVNKVELTRVDKLSKWTVDSGTRGLSVNTACNVLVTCYWGYENNKILEYTTDGQLIREIKLDLFFVHSIELTGGHFVVCGSDDVIVVDEEERAVVRYKNNKQSTDPLMNIPSHLAVDKNDCILVADTLNNRVVMLNSSLSCARDLPVTLDGGLNSPSCLYYDESRGRLLIGEYDRKKRVIVIDNIWSFQPT